jgi:hypothetical protein
MGYARPDCRSLVRCLKCKKAGHYAAACSATDPGMKVGFKPKQPSVDCFLGKVVGKGKDIDTSDWFKERIPTGTSSLPRFQSFVDFGKALHSQNPISDDASTPPNIDLVLFGEVLEHNPLLVPPAISASSDQALSFPDMAFQSADHVPFMPRGFQRLHVLGHWFMSRAVSRRASHSHEDYTILFIDPLPQHQVHFTDIRDVANEFLLQHKRVRIREIQKSHLGQALVYFERIYDWDNLIAQSPHPYGDVSFSFVK